VGVSITRFTEGEDIVFRVDASPSPGMVRCKSEVRLELDGRWCKSKEDKEVLGNNENADSANDAGGGKADADRKNGKEADKADDGTVDGIVEATEAEVGAKVRPWT
jgi:hypothetical protein